MTTTTRWPALVCAALLAASAQADERREILEMRNTVLNLVDALVDQGILTREKAESIKQEAALKAARDAAGQVPVAAADTPADAPASPATADKVVRVPYVPEFVKEEIREQVRKELREDVREDVVAQAREERWGVPDALPDWLSRISWSGDLRLRAEGTLFADKNAANTYFDFLEINAAGGIGAAGVDAFINTTEDRHRLRTRARLQMDVAVAEHVQAGFRVATGNALDPVSTNQTLANAGNRFDIQLDRGWLRFDARDADDEAWLTLSGGRIANPFAYTNLHFDHDLNFDGAAASVRHDFAPGDGRNAVYATAGAFGIEEFDFSSRDKWLLGGQLGHEWTPVRDISTRLAIGYFDYQKVTGRTNGVGNVPDYYFTAPRVLQKGNTLYNIDNDGDPLTQRFALAGDYDILDVGARVDFAQLAPIHVSVDLNYVENVGFDAREILARTSLAVDERTSAWLAQVTTGWPEITKFGDWQVSGSYRYLQANAVLDAYNDSDFHLGGTDARGWIIGARYGLARNTWFEFQYMSSDEIDGPPLGIDLLQLDLNARF